MGHACAKENNIHLSLLDTYISLYSKIIGIYIHTLWLLIKHLSKLEHAVSVFSVWGTGDMAQPDGCKDRLYASPCHPRYQQIGCLGRLVNSVIFMIMFSILEPRPRFLLGDSSLNLYGDRTDGLISCYERRDAYPTPLNLE